LCAITYAWSGSTPGWVLSTLNLCSSTNCKITSMDTLQGLLAWDDASPQYSRLMGVIAVSALSATPWMTCVAYARRKVPLVVFAPCQFHCARCVCVCVCVCVSCVFKRPHFTSDSAHTNHTAHRQGRCARPIVTSLRRRLTAPCANWHTSTGSSRSHAWGSLSHCEFPPSH
jgi:hypothetical protein